MRLSWKFALLLALALAGVLLLAYATPRGLGLVNDSVSYVQGARSLLAAQGYSRPSGDGASKPITHFPPLYSLLLAAIGLFGPDTIPAARAANLVLFGLNIVLVALCSPFPFGRSSPARVRGRVRSSPEEHSDLWPAAPFFAAALFAASEAVLRVHTFALSEPLFLALTLAGLFCLLRALRAERPAWILAAGALAGLSYLTRYVGAAFLAAGALILVARAWNRRGLRQALLFLAAGLPFVLGWSLRNALLTGSATNRDLSFHPIAPSEALEGLKNFWAFLLPSRLGLYDRLPAALWAALLALGLLALVILAGWLWRRRAFAPLLILLHALAYFALVIVSMTTMDASTIFEDRILSPLYVDLILLLAAGLGWLAAHGRRARVIGLLLAFALLLTFVDDTRRALPGLRLDGQGFASTYWTNSELVAAARKLPAEVTIYTNRLAGLNLLTGRPMYALLSPVDPVSQQPRPGYDQTAATIRREVQAGRAALVVFSAQKMLDDPESAWFAQLAGGLPVFARFDDGIIYGVFP